MKNCLLVLLQKCTKSVGTPYTKCIDCENQKWRKILDDHLRVTETSTIYEYNCDVEPYKSTGLCADIISGRNGGMCKKSDCDAFKRRGVVQIMMGEKVYGADASMLGWVAASVAQSTRFIHLKLNCEWDAKKEEPRYSYSVMIQSEEDAPPTPFGRKGATNTDADFKN